MKHWSLTATGMMLTFAATPALGAAPCESLTSLALPHTTITSAKLATESDAADVCRVAAILRPVSDSEIKMEIWLPLKGWNGKLEANGNGGWSGSIIPRTLAAGVTRGYASAMSNLGHDGSSASFALGHPEKLVDFGYRAAHEMAVAAKAIVAGYYGASPKLSYWNGCSAGGRSALMEAQRYPADFDGIIAGAPGLNWTGRALLSVRIAQASHKDEQSYIPPEKYALIHDAALKACDARDGVKDGVIEDPKRCDFDLTPLRCNGADDLTCLTAAQAETARIIYAAVLNPRTNRSVVPGLERGSELGWATMGGPKPFAIGADFFKYVVFGDPTWDFHTFNLENDFGRIEKAENGLLNAMNPDIGAFLKHGKLIQYHGWNDPQIPPSSSVEYYASVLRRLGGAEEVQGSYRLFMVPGMAHCGGGQGTSSFDMLGALERWVEKGEAPNRIEASRVRNGVIDRTRPLCAYPQVAVYKGSGSTDDTANFICGSGLRSVQP